MEVNQLEREEAKILTDKPFEFTVEYKEYTSIKKRPFWMFWQKSTLKEIAKKETFGIKPLCLSTLDRLADYQLNIEIDEAGLSNDLDSLATAQKMVKQSAKDLSKIVALCIMGVNYFKLIDGVKTTDEKEFKRITDVLFNSLTTDELTKIISEVIKSAGYGNFINSTRWMSAKRMTRPNEVE